MEVDVPVWQGSALNVVDDEMMAVAASRKRFWKAFDAQLGLSCEDTDQGEHWPHLPGAAVAARA